MDFEGDARMTSETRLLRQSQAGRLPAGARPAIERRVPARLWLIGIATAALFLEVSLIRATPPEGTAVAKCFQRGYQPPPCDDSTSTSPTPAVPDSGVHACQNQNAMSTAIGLLPGVCPPSSGH